MNEQFQTFSIDAVGPPLLILETMEPTDPFNL